MKKLLMTILIILLATTAFAEKKKGLILGIGAGLGSTTIESTNNYTNVTIEDEYESFYLDGKLGLGFGNLFVFGNLKMIGFDATPDNEEDDEARGFTIAGFGASYYFNRLYITGTLGQAQYRAFESANDDADDYAKKYKGGAIYVGAGLELLKGLTVEIGTYGGGVSHDDYDLDKDFNGVVLSANLLFY